MHQEFFESERSMLDNLLAACATAALADNKIEAFGRALEQILQGPDDKLLVFTEYRATQDRLSAEVERVTGRTAALIHGGQNTDERIAAVNAFESDAAVLISTEAGGEGLNLHRRCHVVLNFDLPWNPARLVQRIGRVYRYGQARHVSVFNFLARDTIDSEVIALAITKVDEMARGMQTVSGEFCSPAFASEIVGELLQQLDIGIALEDARRRGVTRSAQRVQEALRRASEARQLQNEILSAASGFDAQALHRLGRFTTQDLRRFIVRMAPFLCIQAEPRSGERLLLRLPDSLRGTYGEFGNRTVIEATTSRAEMAARNTLSLLDFSGEFVRALVAAATAPAFGGAYAAVRMPAMEPGVVAAFLTRWQDELGGTIGADVAIAMLAPDGAPRIDNGVASQLLRAPVATTAPAPSEPVERENAMLRLQALVEADAARQTSTTKMPNLVTLLAIGEIARETDLRLSPI